METVPRVPRAEVRRRLLAAAAEVLADKGVHGTRVEDIAAAAGFSRGAVYSNFADKEDLITSVVTERVSGMTRDSLAILSTEDTTSSFPDRVGAMLAGRVRDDSAGHRLVLELLVHASRDGRLHAAFATPRLRQRALVADTLRQYATERAVALPMPAETLAVVLIALVNGIAAEYLADPGDVPLDALVSAVSVLLS